MELKCHYATALFDGSTAEGWLEEFAAILRDVVANPSRAVAVLARLNKDAKSAPSPARDSVPQSTAVRTRSAKNNESDLLKSMRDIWRRALLMRPAAVEADDDFFDLGGHSIVAAHLFMMIEKELRLAAPLAALYDSPTHGHLMKTSMRWGKAGRLAIPGCNQCRR